MKELLKELLKFFNSLEEDWKKRKWLKFITKFLLCIAIGSSMMFCLFCLIIKIFQNLQNIMLFVGMIAYGIALIRSMIPKKEKGQEQVAQEPNTILQYDPITLENTYKLVRAGLW